MQYQGGKARLSKYIVPLIHGYNPKVYIEPFLGGANIAPKVEAPFKYASDIDCELIALYKAIKRGWIPPTNITEDQYKDIKINSTDKALRAFVGYGCSWSGKKWSGYATNKKGPNGTSENYAKQAKNSILRKDLSNTKLICTDFSHWTKSKGAVIYCDPPYYGTMQYTFSFPFNRFYQWLKVVAKHNIVLVSEFNLPPQLDYTVIWEKERNLDISNQKKVPKVLEKVFLIHE